MSDQGDDSTASMVDSASKSGSVKNLVMNVFKIAFTAGILVYLYRNGMLDLQRVKSVLTNPGVSLLALSLVFFATLSAFFRWYLLLKGQGLKVPKSEAFRLTMIGTFFNTVLPGAVSGDLVKGFYVVRQQPDGRGKIKAFTTLLLDRLLGLSALICVSFIAMIFNASDVSANPALKSLAGLISLLFAGVLFFYAFVLLDWPFAKKIPALLRKLPAGEHLAKLFEAVKTYESCRHYVVKGMLISIVIFLSVISNIVLLAQSLGGFEGVSLDKFYFLVPFGLLVTAIPVAPAGLGTGHYAFFKLFQYVGSRAGADLFTAYVTFQILTSLIGGVFYLRYRATHSTMK